MEFTGSSDRTLGCQNPRLQARSSYGPCSGLHIMWAPCPLGVRCLDLGIPRRRLALPWRSCLALELDAHSTAEASTISMVPFAYHSYSIMSEMCPNEMGNHLGSYVTCKPSVSWLTPLPYSWFIITVKEPIASTRGLQVVVSPEYLQATNARYLESKRSAAQQPVISYRTA